MKTFAYALLLSLLAAAPAPAENAGESINILHGTPLNEAAVQAMMDASEVAASLWLGPNGKTIKRLTGRFALEKGLEPSKAVSAFIAAHKAAFGLDDPERELLPAGSYAYDDGQVVGFSQVYMSLAVWDKGISATLDASGKLVEINGYYVSTPEVDTVALLTPAEAIERAKDDIGVAPGYKLSIHPVAEKVIFDGRLAYRVVLEFFNMRWECFVDAKNGRVMRKKNTSMLSMALPMGPPGEYPASHENLERHM